MTMMPASVRRRCKSSNCLNCTVAHLGSGGLGGGGGHQAAPPIIGAEYFGVAIWGFEVENVLMKNMALHSGLVKCIEVRLEAEQDAQRMEFQKLRETRAAGRRVIEAENQKRIAVVRTEAERVRQLNQA
ncbi:SPFH domain-containing protein [Hymenobacter terrestris]|uniref:Uncharacterized protein n=1 Tax=Hymenobacter terrestris TaxID=2748310 RepID=A0ABX2Q8H3_9BACT|nr:hypothetical protein [Hymenobacter terrestris]NVO86580.1 hypothetical protein [Hymenobacter terrestris]